MPQGKNVIRKWGKIIDKERMVMNTTHFAVQVVETAEGIIIDVFHRHGDLIDTFTFWNEDVIDVVDIEEYKKKK